MRNQTNKFWKSKQSFKKSNEQILEIKKTVQKSNGQILEIKKIIREIKGTGQKSKHVIILMILLEHRREYISHLRYKLLVAL